MTDLFAEYGHIHGYLQTLAWFFLENILIWSQKFKQYGFFTYLHIACAVLMTLLHTAGTLMMLIATDFDISGLHHAPGFSVLLLFVFILLSGSICLYRKISPSASPTQVYLGNRLHPIFGWIMIIAAKISLYTGSPYKNYLAIVDIISHGLFFVLKFWPKNSRLISEQPKHDMRTISSKDDLAIYGSNYFMFANFVYSTDQLLTRHPGGWKVINSIRCREVDRFVYGVQPLEQFYPNLKAITHSNNFIDLADEPIAKIQNNLTYRNMEAENPVKIRELIQLDVETNIYLIYLQKTSHEGFQYFGYEHLNQIGQYYALKADKIIRLYTSVNFLQKHNIRLMQKYDSNITLSSYKTIKKDDQRNGNVEAKYLLPLMVKVYRDGKFTSKYFIDNNEEMNISRNRGLGLSLHTKRMGNIVVFAGGTGINPFCDLIDLLFKDMLIYSNHQLSSTIKAYDPILNTHPFEHFEFTFYWAIDKINEIHPITLYQCAQLSESKKVRFFFRVKEPLVKPMTPYHKQQIMKSYKSIGFVSDRFEKYLKKQVTDRNLSQIYLCGPTIMTKGLISALKEENATQKYTIV